MDDRMNANHEEQLAAQRAAQWLERLKAAEPQERAVFVSWLKESRGHVRETLLATAWDVVLRNIDPDRRVDVKKLMSDSANVVPVGSGHAPAIYGKNGGSRWPWIASLAASVALVAAVLLVSSGSLRDLMHSNRYATSVGEQRAIELADGSVVSLNTQSSVRVEFSDEARDVYLGAGQAMFSVAHDASRPFRVHVDATVIQAIGTKFDVRRLEDRINVAVIEGRVQINPERPRNSVDTTLAEMSERTRLAAGEAVSIIVNGQVTPPAAIDVAEISAWQQRRLIFRNHTLAEIVDEFGRYNRTPQIRIDGEALGAKRYSGVFDADDPESLLEYLKSDGAVVFERQGQELIIRLRPMM